MLSPEAPVVLSCCLSCQSANSVRTVAPQPGLLDAGVQLNKLCTHPLAGSKPGPSAGLGQGRQLENLDSSKEALTFKITSQVCACSSL